MYCIVKYHFHFHKFAAGGDIDILTQMLNFLYFRKKNVSNALDLASFVQIFARRHIICVNLYHCFPPFDYLLNMCAFTSPSSRARSLRMNEGWRLERAHVCLEACVTHTKRRDQSAHVSTQSRAASTSPRVGQSSKISTRTRSWLVEHAWPEVVRSSSRIGCVRNSQFGVWSSEIGGRCNFWKGFGFSALTGWTRTETW